MLIDGLIHAAFSLWSAKSYRAKRTLQWDYSGTTAVASISILAAFSTSPATCTTAMAG
jgi:hypothetical protein